MISAVSPVLLQVQNGKVQKTQYRIRPAIKMDGNGASSSCNQNKGENFSNSNPQSVASGSDEEGDEEESESSILSNFRKQWEAELTHVPPGDKTNTPTQVSAVSLSNTPTQLSAVSPANLSSGSTSQTSMDRIEEEAKKFFLMGVSFERRGDSYDAVRFYRRAMQLVPDIERRLQLELREEEGVIHPNVDDETDHDREDPECDEDVADDGRPLYVKFIQRIEDNRWQFFEKFREDGKPHFSDFPIEILQYILRWVISSELDVRSLDILGSVCRGFYCLTRDEKLWKMACDRVWSSCDILGSEFSSYREMFLLRPRARFDGCYISRITYVRPGEHSFQDANYRPWHMVEYFRYIRFYPDGRLYFLTCAEKPIVTVGALTESSSKNPSLLKGTYRLYGDNVISASVRKSNPAPQIQTRPRPGKAGKQQSQDITEFHMDFEIQELKEKRNWVLCWTHYAVYINNANMRNNNLNNNGAHGGGITSTFELNPNKYPPLYFSRVKSYALNSESILE